MPFLHYLNASLYMVNAVLWIAYADKPVFGAMWFLVGLGSVWIGREAQRA